MLTEYLLLTWQLLATAVRTLRTTRGGPSKDSALAAPYPSMAAAYVVMSVVANLMSQVVVGIYVAALAGAASALLARGRPATDGSTGGSSSATGPEEVPACASST